MPRTFAYVRVSTTGQTTENQIQEIEAAGFQVEPRRIITETVSGSTAMARRHGFSRLMTPRLQGSRVSACHSSFMSLTVIGCRRRGIG